MDFQKFKSARNHMPTLHLVCDEMELKPGDRKIITAGKRSIGVFNVKGEFFAILNICPHQLAPLAEGQVKGFCPPGPVGHFSYEREGEIIRCPWHGWEFDIKTGKSIFNPHKVKTASYPVRVQETEHFSETEKSVETFRTQIVNRQIFVEA